MAVRTILDVEYARAGGISLGLDLYLPEEAEGRRPLLVWIHGGAWQNGDKGEITPGWGETWVGKGYAAASINYRFSQQAPWPAQIHDCKAAIRFLRAHAEEYGLDEERIGVWGASAGGHLAAMLGTTTEVEELEGDLGNADQSSEVQAVCPWMAPTHLLSMAVAAESRDMSAPDSVLSHLVGGPIMEREDAARDASPVTWVSGDEPPFFICHGDSDRTVPYQQALVLYEALRKTGVEVDLYRFKGADHGRVPYFANADLMRRVEAFFARHLLG